MPYDAAVVAALHEWGEKHGLTDWQFEPKIIDGEQECSVWRVTSTYGSLTIRFTSLLAKRGLGPQLIEELERHQVGRFGKKGNWYVHALTTGHDVQINFREEVSLDLLNDSEDRAWLR